MRRGKVKFGRIENPERRQVAFCKRKSGVLKKARELSLLCDAQIALIIFSPSGKLYEFASANMSRILARYKKAYPSINFITQESQNIEELRVEVDNLRNTITSLQNTQKHMIGEDLNSLSFKELQCLEKQVEVGASKIRSMKEKFLIEHIESLKNEGRSLQEENANLRKQNETSGMRQLSSEQNVIEGPTTTMDRGEATRQQDDVHETNLTLSLKYGSSDYCLCTI